MQNYENYSNSKILYYFFYRQKNGFKKTEFWNLTIKKGLLFRRPLRDSGVMKILYFLSFNLIQ
jgi:hypothetical protein